MSYYIVVCFILYCSVFHIILTVVFQALIMRDMEKLAGAARVAIIYLGAGLGGNLASAIFLPYHVEVRVFVFFLDQFLTSLLVECVGSSYGLGVRALAW